MNINNILSVTPNQAAMSDGQNTTSVTTENGAGDFNQMLQNLFRGVTTNLPTTTKSTPWPMALLEMLGQSPNASGPALDLLEGAPTLANQLDESAISLTDLMTALQPMVTESQLAMSTSLPDGQPNGAAKKLAKVIDETNVALLTLMSGFNLLQPPAAPSQLPSLPMADQEMATQMAQSNPALTPLVVSGNPANSGTQANTATELNLFETAAVSTKISTQAAPAQTNPAFTQELDKQMTTAPVSSGLTQPGDDSAEHVLKSNVQPAETAANPILTSAAFNPELHNVQPATFNVQTGVETNTRLPEIPALHQIVDRLSLMTQNGQTEVRLHLRPESLGHLSIQLHLVDGDIAVRMVAETAQAQKLIQDHLPQLKAAFTAQGLQLNDMAVTVGSGASAFDLSGRQSHNNWSQPSAHTPAYPSFTDKTEPAAARTVSRTWSNGYAVDYQV